MAPKVLGSSLEKVLSPPPQSLPLLCETYLCSAAGLHTHAHCHVASPFRRLAVEAETGVQVTVEYRG